MKFLLDEQMPPDVVVWLKARGHEASHVRELGLRSAPDREIWRWAADAGSVILTKDRDYAIRRRVAKTGPVIVWLRFGNHRLEPFLGLLWSAWPDIEKRLSDGETLIEAPAPTTP